VCGTRPAPVRGGATFRPAAAPGDRAGAGMTAQWPAELRAPCAGRTTTTDAAQSCSSAGRQAPARRGPRSSKRDPYGSGRAPSQPMTRARASLPTSSSAARLACSSSVRAQLVPHAPDRGQAVAVASCTPSARWRGARLPAPPAC
jgi:hypothetical protein